MLLHDSENRGEAEPRPLAHFFRGEKWLEDPRGDFRRHPTARVFNSQTDKAPGLNIGFATERGFVPFYNRRTDLKFAAIWHRIPCVNGEVDQHLFHHADIRFDPRQIRSKFKLKVD